MPSFNPPPIKVVGERRPLRDFIPWMLTAPVISERAKGALEDLIGPYVQILPLIHLKGKPFFAVNVTALADCLDPLKSEIRWSVNDPTRIQHISRYYFLPDRIPGYPIWKLTKEPSLVFVNRSFVDCVIKHGLRGASFADPSKDPLEAILSRKSSNVVEGVPE